MCILTYKLRVMRQYATQTLETALIEESLLLRKESRLPCRSATTAAALMWQTEPTAQLTVGRLFVARQLQLDALWVNQRLSSQGIPYGCTITTDFLSLLLLKTGHAFPRSSRLSISPPHLAVQCGGDTTVCSLRSVRRGPFGYHHGGWRSHRSWPDGPRGFAEKL